MPFLKIILARISCSTATAAATNHEISFITQITRLVKHDRLNRLDEFTSAS